MAAPPKPAPAIVVAAIRAGSADHAANLLHTKLDPGGPAFPGALAAYTGDLLICEDAVTHRATNCAAVAVLPDRGAVPGLMGGRRFPADPGVPGVRGAGAQAHHPPDRLPYRLERRGAGERFGRSPTMRRASEMPWVERIVRADQRGIDSARALNVADAERWGVTFVPGREVVRDGIGRGLAAIPEGAEM